MKKIFVLAFVAALLVCELFLSCSNGSDSPMVGGTGVGVTQTGGGGTTTTTSNEPTAAENAKVVVAAIKALTESGTIKATGKLDNDSIREINAALKELASRDENILVTLDLSEVTGLTRLESAYRYGSYITSQSFFGCENLAGVILPSTLKTIESHAFHGCSKIKSITIPNSVYAIDEGAFYRCAALEEITLPFAGVGRNSSSVEDGHFGKIFGRKGNDDLFSFYQWYSKDTSGNDFYASYYRPRFLKSVKITGSIREYAFACCNKLTSVVIGGAATSIGEKAFMGCTELASVTIGKNVTSVANRAFDGCTGLVDMNYLGTLAQWCNIDFMSEYSNPCYYTGKIYIQGQEIVNLEIPEGVEKIKGYAFYNCKGITSLNIPSSVKEIGGYAFWCVRITNLRIPSSVKKIERYAFRCAGLTNIVFSDTNNWYVDVGYLNEEIDSSILADPATAATYLGNTYSSYHWYKL